jgi:ElaB/YqjD/DUF883 family membrane-anchored ribosome-binding protein
LSGKQVFSHNNNTYELRKPSLSLKMKADLLYVSAYENNIYSDFILMEDIDELLFETNIISRDHKKILAKIEKSLDNQKISLYKSYYDNLQKNKIKQKIKNTREDIDKFYQEQHSLDYLTLEHYCDNIKNEFIITNSLYHYESDRLVFNYDTNISFNLFNSIMSIISHNVIDVTTYKAIARNDYWRNYWNNNKTNILDEPVKEWSEEQKSLINISCMYDKIHEHPECPKEDIISDDDALDGWMLLQRQENEKQKKEKGVDNMLSGKIKDSAEVFLMANNREQAQDIFDLNSEQGLRTIQQKMNMVVSSDGPIRDAELPDVKARIFNQLKEQQKRG